MKKSASLLIPFAISVFILSCNSNQPAPPTVVTEKAPEILEEDVTYGGDIATLKGYVAYDKNQDSTRPGVIVIPEWWGLNDYTKRRARELAELGYIAMAIDMYGNGKTADNPDSASAFAAPFYQNPQMAKARFDEALTKLKSFPQTDKNHIAAIGYCFGGGMVLNMARLGEDLDGVVSFHGNLSGVPAERGKIKAQILVCHGAEDKFVKPAEVAEFKKQMDAVGVNYIFKEYPGATHAFTNPDATAIGEKFNMPIAYNAAADTASWNEMKDFLKHVFK